MNLLNVLATVSSMTLVSRVLGFVRDALIARVFGAGLATDAFFIAFKLPNLLRRIFAEGAFSQAFVPVLGEYKYRKTPEATRQFIAHISGMLGTVLLLITALGMLAAPAIIWISAPGFAKDPAKFTLTIDLLRITFPYILFISLSSLVGGILNTWNKFSVPAFTPTFLNLSFILFALFFTSFFNPPVMALAWAVFCGGMVQLLYQLPFLKKIGMLVSPRLGLGDAEVMRVVRQMGPAIFGVSIAQISLLINSTFASFLPEGSVSWMYYADRMMEFPTGVLGVALGTILLPALTKHATNQATDHYSALLDWGIRLTLLLALPATVGLGLLSKPLITTLFMYGKFNLHDVLMTQYALIAYAVGLLGLILIKVLAPGFYARQNIKTPVKIAIVTLIVTQLMNLVFIFPLKHAGLSLSIGLGSCLNAGLLWYKLRTSGIYQPLPGWRSFIVRLLSCVLLMAAVLLGTQIFLAINWQAPASERCFWLLLLIAEAVSVYFAALYVLGFRPRDFLRQEQ